jgi:hypothetical protein
MGRRMISTPATLTLLALPLLAAGSGCVMMLRAGSLYTGGRPEEGRRRGRRAGWIVCGGGLALAATTALLVLSGAWPRGPAAIAGALLAAASGITGLLGGLSGKPRPAGGAVALLLLAAALCLVAAA